jgi:F0F1-type ATP synthase assembly protein I
VVHALSTFSIVVAGFFVGLYIDKGYSTLPLFTISFVFLGILSTIYGVLKKK